MVIASRPYLQLLRGTVETGREKSATRKSAHFMSRKLLCRMADGKRKNTNALSADLPVRPHGLLQRVADGVRKLFFRLKCRVQLHPWHSGAHDVLYVPT